jgi:hypothetical protein
MSTLTGPEVMAVLGGWRDACPNTLSPPHSHTPPCPHRNLLEPHNTLPAPHTTSHPPSNPTIECDVLEGVFVDRRTSSTDKLPPPALALYSTTGTAQSPLSPYPVVFPNSQDQCAAPIPVDAAVTKAASPPTSKRDGSNGHRGGVPDGLAV